MIYMLTENTEMAPTWLLAKLLQLVAPVVPKPVADAVKMGLKTLLRTVGIAAAGLTGADSVHASLLGVSPGRAFYVQLCGHPSLSVQSAPAHGGVLHDGRVCGDGSGQSAQCHVCPGSSRSL